ncbi:hypothetical protein H112_04085 [Trichophyton rubrum D6]|uniref:Regulator of phospholipase D SRF1 n=3 Tax=Trichophyton TaxID=5550 RepID=F2SP68_TRIRC|nr:uncharacterized protein TERG_03867 [Trichophyton rubrum CBS 118892]EZF23184.1 hypothetical protein H100_04090 [Trichophyton rubrum MR850]EZF42229.1 hypothetical protein H102_04078 [Trichophyton rubrum CBS 100081]EZF52879.1 hypothetical protein H103_04089 [Trichophyton rubrum CBS 288.86]EZF63469.1 hypothetical protein H104_04078 [Trichophyton rubrum CBS 289.86]EZF74135.1 hypothetical protein H105_04108 [Trichophyton soudanense CBS 452.61]EZF84823.1 hypothetical protein H110_04084 [Trichophy
MAAPGEAAARSHRSTSRGGSPRRKADLKLLEPPLSRRRSAQSVSGASQSDEQRSVYQRIGSSRHGQSSKSYSPHSQGSIPRTQGSGKLAVRSVPAWVKHAEDEETPSKSPSQSRSPSQSQSFPVPPGDVHVASHHYSPKAKDFAFDRESRREKDIEQGEGEFSERNRLYTQYTQESRWKTFTRSVPQAREPTHQQNKIVDADWLNRNFGDYSDPWQGYIDEKADESARQSATFIQRRKIWMKGFQYKILHSPMVPLIIRLTVFIFSAIALSLGGSIRHLSTTHSRPQGPSPLMAIIFDAIALVYLVYITYDEYTGKPLGLRSASAKIRLIFLDLVFIVFASANLSLAFASLSDVNGSCSSGDIDLTINPRNDKICDRQKVLAAVLLVVLVAWLMTFMISALRVIERVAAK